MPKSCLKKSGATTDKSSDKRKIRFDDHVIARCFKVRLKGAPIFRVPTKPEDVRRVDFDTRLSKFWSEYAQAVAVQKAFTLARHVGCCASKDHSEQCEDIAAVLQGQHFIFPLGRIALDSEIENWDKDLGGL